MNVGKKLVSVGTLAVLSLSLVGSQIVRADDATARALLAEANTAWASRATMASLEEAITKLAAAEAQAVDAQLKYDILIKASNALYLKGIQAKTDDARMDIHDKAMTKAKTARALNDELAEAPYFYAINLGRWALAKGVIASLQRKKELMDSAEAAIDRVTRDGEEGKTIDGYGPNRTLGRMYFKLPSFAGGNRTKALALLEEATEQAPKQALNTVYLAEVLNAGNAADKARARRILDELLAQDVNTFNPARVAETGFEMEEGRQLRKEMGN